MTTVDTFEEVHGYIEDAVVARRHIGAKRAFAEIARDLGWTPRRVVAVLRREVSRLWGDEVEQARTWRRAFIEHEIARANHRAELLRLSREKMDAEELCTSSRP